MRRTLSLRDYQLILVPFVALLCIGVTAAIVFTSHPQASDSDAKQPQRSSASRSVDGRNSQSLRPDKPNYDVIGKRNLFGSDSSTSQSIGEQELPPPLAPTPVEIRAAATAPPSPQGPAQDRIAVVGMVTIANERLAVMEDLGRGETKFVSLGGEAYGYRLLTVSSNEATLSKNGRQYAVALGENKPEPRPRTQRGLAPDGSMVVAFGGQGGPGGGRGNGGPGGGGALFTNMTDEERTQLREQLRNMSPEERQAYFQSRMNQNQNGDQGGSYGGFAGGGFPGSADAQGSGPDDGSGNGMGRRQRGGGPGGGGNGGRGFGGPGGGGPGGGGFAGGGGRGGFGNGQGGGFPDNSNNQ